METIVNEFRRIHDHGKEKKFQRLVRSKEETRNYFRAITINEEQDQVIVRETIFNAAIATIEAH